MQDDEKIVFDDHDETANEYILGSAYVYNPEHETFHSHLSKPESTLIADEHIPDPVKGDYNPRPIPVGSFEGSHYGSATNMRNSGNNYEYQTQDYYHNEYEEHDEEDDPISPLSAESEPSPKSFSEKSRQSRAVSIRDLYEVKTTSNVPDQQMRTMREPESQSLQKCTFKPKINKLPGGGQEENKDPVHMRIGMQDVQRRQQLKELAVKKAEEDKLSGCTFKPAITVDKSNRMDVMKSTPKATVERMWEDYEKRKKKQKEIENPNEHNKKPPLTAKATKDLIGRMWSAVEKKQQKLIEYEHRMQRPFGDENAKPKKPVDVDKLTKRLTNVDTKKNAIQNLLKQEREQFVLQHPFRPQITERARMLAALERSERDPPPEVKVRSMPEEMVREKLVELEYKVQDKDQEHVAEVNVLRNQCGAYNEVINRMQTEFQRMHKILAKIRHERSSERMIWKKEYKELQSKVGKDSLNNSQTTTSQIHSQIISPSKIPKPSMPYPFSSKPTTYNAPTKAWQMKVENKRIVPSGDATSTETGTIDDHSNNPLDQLYTSRHSGVGSTHSIYSDDSHRRSRSQPSLSRPHDAFTHQQYPGDINFSFTGHNDYSTNSHHSLYDDGDTGWHSDSATRKINRKSLRPWRMQPFQDHSEYSYADHEKASALDPVYFSIDDIPPQQPFRSVSAPRGRTTYSTSADPHYRSRSTISSTTSSRRSYTEIEQKIEEEISRRINSRI